MKVNPLHYVALLLFSSSILSSCGSSYQVVKSNRAEYPINKDVPADSTVIRTYSPYKLKMDSQMNAVIGHSAVTLTKKGENGESLLGNFFADAALHEALKIDPAIDFALPSTNGGLRNDLPQGPLTLSNVFELMPFENELLSFDLKGSDVAAILNFIARTGGQPISGITMKIVDKEAVNVMINGKAFDINSKYHVLTSDYIAGGGDGMNSFKDPIKRSVLGLKVRDALITYIREKEAKGDKIIAVLDHRMNHD